MTIEPGKFCPLIQKDCLGLQCSWFTQVRGTHPQSGADVDEWACAIVWMPMLAISTAQEVRQGAAATERMGNVIADVGKNHNVQVAIAMANIVGRDPLTIEGARS